MAGVRFTAWLSEGERSGLRRIAHQHGCSENYLVRIAVRAMLFGDKIPEYLLDARNDSNGGNGNNEIAPTAR